MAPILQNVARWLAVRGDQLLQMQNPKMDRLPPPTGAGLTHGAVASENQLCSSIGTDLLKSGGNAADAIVGTVLCVGVIGLYHSGIGGGGFMLIRSPKGEYEAIDFRESAPAAATEDMYRGRYNQSVNGGLASGVPGELRGLEYLHKKYGKLPWKDVVYPAAEVAQRGWRVGSDLMKYINFMQDKSFMMEHPWAEDLAPTGKLIKLGDMITRERYAATLLEIAHNGPDVFYEGYMAQSMIDAVQESGGIMTMDDLKEYSVKKRAVSKTTYRGYKVFSTTAPTSGTMALSILKILEGFEDLWHPQTEILSLHRIIEAMKWGYAGRTRLGDPDFAPEAVEEELQLLNLTHLEDIRSKIKDDRTFPPEYYNPDYIEILDDKGTAQVSAADATGLAISITSTINTLFGSKVMVPETGVIMNNEMDDFSIPGRNNSFGFHPSKSNLIQPGKRPLSSVSTIIVERPDGKVYFVTGAAGGSRIPTATVQSILNVIDRNMTVKEALMDVRVHDQLLPTITAVEQGFDRQVGQQLRVLGHNVTEVMRGLSAVHAVRWNLDESWEAVGEPRQRDSGGKVVF